MNCPRSPRPVALAALLGAVFIVSTLAPGLPTLSWSAAPANAARAEYPTIIVYKSKRRLLYFDNDILRRRFPIVLGKAPAGNKMRRGDNRTPEGEYYITYKSDKSRFYRFLGLSYPNIDDARRGLLNNLISRSEFQRIRNAITRRGRPPSGTALGGYIGIHGEGEYRDFTSRHRINWTEGCISVSDKDMRILYDRVQPGTPVLIFP